MASGSRIQLPYTVGETTYPPLEVDAVDATVMAIGPASILSYMRPKMLLKGIGGADPNVNFTERMAVPVLAGSAGGGTGTSQVLTATDANFNGKPSIDVSAVSVGPYNLGLTMTADFTFIAPIRLASASAQSFFGVAGTYGYLCQFSAGHVIIGDTWGDGVNVDLDFAGAAPAVNTTVLALVSQKAASKVNRFKLNGAAPTSGTSASAFAPTSAHVVHPLGYVAGSGGLPLLGKHAGWLLLNQAYGDGGSFDAGVDALIAAWRTDVGA